MVGQAKKTGVAEAVEIAERNGVPKDRALEYYGTRDKAWVINRCGLALPSD